MEPCPNGTGSSDASTPTPGESESSSASWPMRANLDFRGQMDAEVFPPIEEVPSAPPDTRGPPQQPLELNPAIGHSIHHTFAWFW